MKISLSEIMNKADFFETIVPTPEHDFFVYEGVEYPFAKKDVFELTLKNLGGKKVRITLKGVMPMVGSCARCLKPVDFEVSVDFAVDIDFSDGHASSVEDLDEISYIDGYDLDVDQLIDEEILLGFPMRVLCMEDCKGICKVCGADLNQGECGCDRTELDPRMSVIRDIFNNFKEV